MKRFLLIGFAGLALLAQKSKAPEPDPEARWICKIGSYHHCHCPMMVNEASDAWREHCKSQPDYEKCLLSEPKACDVIQKSDTAHPEHSCKRTCKHARCGCSDSSPVCEGPELNKIDDNF